MKKSLATLKLSMKGGAFLGPSSDFKKESAWLINAVRSTSPESLNPKAARKTSKPRPSGRTRPRTKRRSQRKTSRARAKRSAADGAPDSGRESNQLRLDICVRATSCRGLRAVLHQAIVNDPRKHPSSEEALAPARVEVLRRLRIDGFLGRLAGVEHRRADDHGG